MTVQDAQRDAGRTDAAPVVAPPPGHPRFPLVDALRAVAALTVLVFHTAYATSAVNNHAYGRYLERLNVGVTLFFVISGFLLYRPFVAARVLGAPATRGRDYARRRVLRIVPGYWFALTVLAIYPGLSGVFTAHWWIYYGFLQTYSPGTVLRGIGPAWTLCIEVTFYLLLPVYALSFGRVVRRARPERQVAAELTALVLISAMVIAYRVYLHHSDIFSPWMNSIAVYGDWFAAGMILAVLSVAEQGGIGPRAFFQFFERWSWVPWAGAIVAFWMVSAVVGGPHLITLFGHIALVFSDREDIGVHCLFTVVAVLLLAPAVLGRSARQTAAHRGIVRNVLANRQLAWLGLISYGLYLWQGSIKTLICQPTGQVFVTDSCRMHGVGLLQRTPFLSLTVTTFIGIVICAAVSYYVVERPLLRLKYRRRPPPPPSPAGPSRPEPAVAVAADR